MYLCCSDDPKEMPAFVASNEAADGCTIKPHGGNIFAAIWYNISSVLTDYETAQCMQIACAQHVQCISKSRLLL